MAKFILQVTAQSTNKPDRYFIFDSDNPCLVEELYRYKLQGGYITAMLIDTNGVKVKIG